MNLIDYFNVHSFEYPKSKKHIGGYVDFLSEKTTFNPKRYTLAIFNINTSNDNELLIKSKQTLYHLHAHFNKSIRIIDLGELKKGTTFSDTLFATRDVCEYLLQLNVIPVILSDNSYIPYPIYLAYELLKKPVTLCNIDYTIFSTKKQQHFLPQILSRKSNTLFNYIHIGSQNFYTPKEDFNYITQHLFDYVRLGEIHANLIKTEPLLRDSDSCIINSTCLTNEFLPELKTVTPSGITHNEICQISRYAGLSEKMSSFCLCLHSQTYISAMSYAQILWHFVDGVASRVNDYPILSAKKLIQYHVEVSKNTFIVFYKSPLTDRWWLEIPLPKTNYKKKWLIACDEQDYIDATQGNIPEKWHKSLKKVF